MGDGILLDSHAFLWALTDDARLGNQVRAALAEPDRSVHLSTATVWELGIRVALGRLVLPVPLRELVRAAIAAPGGLRVLAVQPEHALRASELPLHHRDPFDRMLVAQAHAEHLVLATVDARLPAYGVRTLW